MTDAPLDHGPLPERARIVVAGAGAIGQYVGIKLAAAGRSVAFLGRKTLAEAARKDGLVATAVKGAEARVAPGAAAMSEDPAILAEADVILVAVKSRDTEAMAREIAAHAPKTAVVVSLQNGLRNVERLRDGLPGWDVRAGMVPFNVVMRAPGVVHRGTGGASGDLSIEAGRRAGVGAALTVKGMRTHEHQDLTGVQWTKLLINQNNALNALSGLSLYDELSDRGWRALFAACVEEGLAEARAERVKLAPFDGPSPKRLPRILRLPNWAFRIVMALTMGVDREAGSSMQDDLKRMRLTEIDDLQGEISRRAHARGARAPTCAAVAILIREAEAAGEGPPKLTPARVEEMVRSGRS